MLMAYGVDMANLSPVKNNHKQKTKGGCSYSDRFELKYKISLGSMLDSLIFNVLINDIFFETKKIQHF